MDAPQDFQRFDGKQLRLIHNQQALAVFQLVHHRAHHFVVGARGGQSQRIAQRLQQHLGVVGWFRLQQDDVGVATCVFAQCHRLAEAGIADNQVDIGQRVRQPANLQHIFRAGRLHKRLLDLFRLLPAACHQLYRLGIQRGRVALVLALQILVHRRGGYPQLCRQLPLCQPLRLGKGLQFFNRAHDFSAPKIP